MPDEQTNTPVAELDDERVFEPIPGQVFSACVYRGDKLEDFEVDEDPNGFEDSGVRLVNDVIQGTLCVYELFEGGERTVETLTLKFTRHAASKDAVVSQLMAECYGV